MAGFLTNYNLLFIELHVSDYIYEMDDLNVKYI